MVRQAQAHAWAEVWLAGQGWVRVDPTAVVATRAPYGVGGQPHRGRGGALRAAPRRAGRGGPWRRLRTLWGAAENTWDQWVLGYDVARQVRLLRRLGVADPTWPHLAAGLGVCAAGILTGLAGLVAWRSMPRGDPLQRAYERFCRRLGRRGLPKEPAETPLAYARRAASKWPAHGSEDRSASLPCTCGRTTVLHPIRRCRPPPAQGGTPISAGPGAVGRQRRLECL